MLRTQLKRFSQKRLQKLQQQKELTKRDREIYLEIWEERAHKCEVTGKPLGEEIMSTFFHHLMKKEENAYPEYRWEKWNIILISSEVHEKSERMGNKWHPVLKEKYLEALQKHRTFNENQETDE